MDPRQFFDAAWRAIAIFEPWAKAHTSISQAAADHLCYKCGSAEEFNAVRELFESKSPFIYQSIVSGRRIAIIKMCMPLGTLLGDIWYLELSDQKPDGSQTSGFDHIEIYPRNRLIDSTQDLVALIGRRGATFRKSSRPHHATYDTVIGGGFAVRVEDEPLIAKIVREEMRGRGTL